MMRAGDFAGAHEWYDEAVVVEWPQSGERIRGKGNLLALRETHYFAEPFEPPEWRARWVERMDEEAGGGVRSERRSER